MSERAREVRITVDGGDIVGDLHPGAVGTVLFAHGSGSSRFSARNRMVAERLRQDGLGTLLFDLLTPEEDEVDRRTREHRFDIELLTDRVLAAMEWVRGEAGLADRPLGLFGSSTGAAAALSAAGAAGGEVRAVVSRGGRTDLATTPLEDVDIPARLIVGGNDPQVLAINRRSAARLGGEADLQVVEGASHLFEEPGALERVAELAAQWFVRWFDRGPRA